MIASGSKGNMTYVATKTTRVVIDAGVSLPDAQKRVKKHNLDLSRIDAVLVTHEHGDHIKFLATFIKKTHAHLYISKLSYNKIDQQTKLRLANVPIHFIEANNKYKINDLEFLTLKLSHDSANIFGFIMIDEDKKLAYITDTGFFPLHYIELIKQVDALIIEANHDVEMLLESNRPTLLKERILSPLGHMSNYICEQILSAVLNERHKIVMLAHISEECNCLDVIKKDVLDKISQTNGLEVTIANQWEASKLYEL
jgi:phosphoribosyl 1,2-cyclic phosphodiesterase